MKKIAVLLTVFNRKINTLECLSKVYSQKFNTSNYELDVYLVDDGSNDGTSSAVLEKFSKVNVIIGNGELFWNRGMYLAWDTAVKNCLYDYYLWLNDDTILFDDAIGSLLNYSDKLNNKSIIVGTTVGHVSNCCTYGGRTIRSTLVVPTTDLIECDFFNGNIVLIPKYAFDKVGLNDPLFRHSLGDFDYGLRAKKIGVKSYVAPGILGKCDTHSELPKWCNPKTDFFKRWQLFRTPLGHNPEEFFIYEKRHFGLHRAIYHYFTNHLRVFFPSLWVNN